MTDLTRFSAATGLPTPVDDGTPAGLPTPAGEPTDPQLPFGEEPAGEAGADDQPDDDGALNASSTSATSADETAGDRPGPALKSYQAIGALVISWGALEAATADKLIAMRRTFGDVRALGGRSRPTLQRLLAELRALVAMRDRHDKQVLTIIAALDGDLQRLSQFREMVVNGAQGIVDDDVICHDQKNIEHRLPIATVMTETARIEEITRQIIAL